MRTYPGHAERSSAFAEMVPSSAGGTRNSYLHRRTQLNTHKQINKALTLAHAQTKLYISNQATT